jgi:hypothetical protein
MASISLAMIIASFTNNERQDERQAATLSAMIAVPLSFRRRVYPAAATRPRDIWRTNVPIYDLFPWTHAISGLRAVLTCGEGLSGDVVFEMTWLIILTATLFVVGVICYSKARLGAEK